jgi:hypothetical protein
MGMAGPKREKHEVARGTQRRQLIAEMYLRGMTQPAIARELGISQPAVSKHLARVRSEWVASAARDYGERVAEELARLDALEATAWEAYRRSALPLKPGGPDRPGDSRFLDTVFRCREAKLKVLGALKGTAVNVQQTVTVAWDTLLQTAREERAANPDPIAARLRAIEAELASTPPQLLPAPTNGTANYNGG